MTAPTDQDVVRWRAYTRAQREAAKAIAMTDTAARIVALRQREAQRIGDELARVLGGLDDARNLLETMTVLAEMKSAAAAKAKCDWLYDEAKESEAA